MKTLELRRHARRDPQADRLSPAGRADAEDVGRTSGRRYDVVFVSPAQRAAETADAQLTSFAGHLAGSVVPQDVSTVSIIRSASLAQPDSPAAKRRAQQHPNQEGPMALRHQFRPDASASPSPTRAGSIAR